MEGLYFAAAQEVLMLPSLGGRVSYVTLIAPCASCARMLTLWARLGRTVRTMLENKIETATRYLEK